jgi:tripartite-type tricarboxylate transporter receptor subunit TctC
MGVMMLRRIVLGVTLVLALALLPAGVIAQTYPSKTVTMVVPYSAGGGTDTLTRIFAKKLSERWGQSVVVENRPGADSAIGTAVVAHAPADGYHLLLVLPSLPINASLKLKLPFDSVRDFAPITNLASSSWTFVVNPQVAANSLSELIALAKSQPGKLSIGVSDPQSRLAAELFMRQAGVKLTVVPYKGGSQMAADLLGGHLQVGLATVPTIFQHYKSGAIRVLAVSSAKRAASMPNIPTAAEAGLPNYEVTVWYGLCAPAGTPKEILDTIQRAITEVASQPDVKARLSDLSAEFVPNSTEEFAAFTRSEFEKYARIIKDAGIQPE